MTDDTMTTTPGDERTTPATDPTLAAPAVDDTSPKRTTGSGTVPDTGTRGGSSRTPTARAVARSKLAARREAARERDKRIEDSLTTLLSNSSRIDLVAYTRDAAIAAAHADYERATAGIHADMAGAVGTLRAEGLTLDEIAAEAELSGGQVRELNKLARTADTTASAATPTADGAGAAESR